ncbi:MAG: hypothetical protein R3B13_20420 [Polyangiaceae bacterium]
MAQRRKRRRSELAAQDQPRESPQKADRVHLGKGQLLLAFVFGIAVSVACLYKVVTYRVWTEADLETVTATPESVSVLLSRKEPFVDIFLPDDPICYRVPIDRLRDIPDRGGFVRAASRPGARLSFQVERGARMHPKEPAGDPKPTVFIETVAVDGKPYYTLEQRNAWSARDIIWARLLAVAFPLMTLYLGRLLWQRRQEFEP